MAPFSASDNTFLPLEVKPRLDLWCNTKCLSWSQPKTRAVRFSRNIEEVHEILHISEFSEEEVRACWYNRDDYSRIRSYNHQVIDLIEMRRPLPEDQCKTGLETMTQYENFLCQQRIREAICAVLTEQDDQLYEGHFDPEYLALRYSAHSSHCKEAARMMGQQQAVGA
jgi:hypothetical protein